MVRNLIRRLLGRGRFASGGILHPDPNRFRGERIVYLSPGRYTWRRPGESHTEVMERLVRGEDL